MKPSFKQQGKKACLMGMFPPLLIKGVKYIALDSPLSGSATMTSGTGRGIWSEGWTVPLTEQVTWTFTPDAQ